ncbi:MAG: thermonuclease family protein [Deltaproteobacteria bacterium]|nr:thermonuclease family protein [Candidatus Zymogenaceae bacterium]
MKYKIIKGSFHVKGYSPDGDSIRFQANESVHWDYFTWKNANKKKSEKKQLRFEAIDALETHYEESHQPRSFGVAALEILLEMIGIKDVIYNIAVTKIVSASDGSSGFIAASSIDMYERPISLVFPADVDLVDGRELDAGDLPLDDSINMKLLELGLVYPTFYGTMQDELLTAFTSATEKAREKRVGIWALDKTPEFMLWNKDTIQDDVIIFPKLFRRLTAFFEGRSSYDELNEYLKKQKDKLLIRSTGEKKMMHEIMEIDGRHIKFLMNPENLIFEPKG